MHGFPSFEWLAVQMWIFRRNSNKWTKSSSYRKYCYNCLKMVHVGLHSIVTYHKKFGWEKKKIKNILCRVSASWHSAKKPVCRVPTLGARQKLMVVSYRWLLTVLYRALLSPSVWHSTKICAYQSPALGKRVRYREQAFAEYATRQSILCRVPDKKLGKTPSTQQNHIFR
jgi:hypothetical protein